MVSQVVIGVGDKQVEDDPRPQFAKIGVGLRAMLDQYSGQLQVADARRGIITIDMAGQGQAEAKCRRFPSSVRSNRLTMKQ